MFRGFTVVLDPIADRLLLFGGEVSAILVNELWALPLSGTPAWTRIEPAGFPPVARKAHAAIFDPTRNRMIVYGASPTPTSRSATCGRSPSIPARYGRNSCLRAPLRRNRHSYNPIAAYDPVGDRLVLFGGPMLAGGER